MHLHFDPIGGAAGDMFIAALTHAFPEHRGGLFAAIRAAGVPQAIGLRLFEHADSAMSGMRFDVMETPPPTASKSPYRLVAGGAHTHHRGELHAHQHAHGQAHDHSHEHAHGAQHAHRKWADIRAQLVASPLAPAVIKRALDIFTLIAQAEAQVHAVAQDEVGFHEVGAWDSIADVVGAAFLLEAIGAASYSCAPLPLGSGRVQTAHGLLPVPTPATALLLQGLATFDDGRGGERVTPTGAAIFRYLNPQPSAGLGARVLQRAGTGFGTKRFEGISNVLRVLVFEHAPAALQSEQIAQIEFEVDDQTPEDLAVGLERLRARESVLDVTQTPVFGKKGRIAARVQVLARANALDETVRACFAETTTIGLRHQLVQRSVLARHNVATEDAPHRVNVKIVQRPGGASAKAEMDALADAGDHAARERLRTSAVQQAMSKEKR